GLLETRAPELEPGGAVAELLAELRAVTRPGDVAQVRRELERVRVLRVVATLAQGLGRGAHDGPGLVRAVGRDVQRAGAVAGLALHVAQVLVAGQGGAAR